MKLRNIGIKMEGGFSFGQESYDGKIEKQLIPLENWKIEVGESTRNRRVFLFLKVKDQNDGA